MKLSSGQYEKLSELFLGLAKAMFITAFAAPAVSPAFTIYISLQSVTNGFVFTVLALLATKRKEE